MTAQLPAASLQLSANRRVSLRSGFGDRDLRRETRPCLSEPWLTAAYWQLVTGCWPLAADSWLPAAL